MPRPTEEAGALKASVDPEDIPGIVEGLRQTFNTDKTRSKAWRLAQLDALDKLLTEGCDDLCKAMYADIHKSDLEGWFQEIALVRGEIYEAKQHLDHWMADEHVGSGLLNTPSQSMVQKDPLGVVLILGAWNYNVLLSLHPLVGAIAAGNCAIIKPGSYSETSSHTICRLVQKYMDPECIRAVEGNRHITSSLLEQKLDKIFFTGSPFVGQVVAEAAAKQLCPVVLELGGKSPCVIDRKADLAIAAKRCAWGALMNSGQTCVRPDYFMVHEAIADDFIKTLKRTIVQFYGRDPQKTKWFGRIVNDAAFRRLNGCVEDAKQYLVHGGENDANDRFIAPSVFDFGTDMHAFESSALMQDEIFGPLIPIFRYRDFDGQVLPFIRARPKPLALYCFTSDNELAERALRLTSSGAALINDVVVHLSNSELPFGGVGASGMGSYHGKRSFDAFSHHKAVMRRGTLLDAPQRYPPYSSLDEAVLRLGLHPKVSFHFTQMTNFITDKKNFLITLMTAYIAHQHLRSRM
ncbi:Aldehyde dehydrogenase [Hondaea fermentalgiana]|uniref:Aldehyde dehydrogenase n=1 Tax=Hondaea fermentalgiana TaxID=2315210 RepID=A0A2R5GNW6_9STRA|nr:Aldehyde dehydrogenase [Hondaea fermentalgiana]|eukprot:GBG31448.1 Aldehyde dehydrogenase [Hondaea fermentalgiana]